MRNRPTLFVIAAPSGGGKTSLIAALLERDPRVRLSISHTTRPARPGEVDGQHYYFVDEPTFLGLVERGAMLEHARVYGNLYGTGRDAVERILGEGKDVLLDIDWQGARQVRTAFPEACLIYLLPPSLEELQRRLERRGQDGPEVIARRMAAARSDIAHAPEFDFIVVNDDFDAALADLQAIVRERRARRPQPPEKIVALLAQFLETE